MSFIQLKATSLNHLNQRYLQHAICNLSSEKKNERILKYFVQLYYKEENRRRNTTTKMMYDWNLHKLEIWVLFPDKPFFSEIVKDKKL